MSDNINKYCIADETSAPYENNESPYFNTKEDEEFDKYIINKYHLATKEPEDTNK